MRATYEPAVAIVAESTFTELGDASGDLCVAIVDESTFTELGDASGELCVAIVDESAFTRWTGRRCEGATP